MSRLPDFLMIGGMKCATTTLDLQLAAQNGIFMGRKEIGFFQGGENWGRGVPWYAEQFADAPEGALIGESCTEYTKLPTFPETVTRLKRTLPGARLLYVVRHPVDRLTSHYVHDWSKRLVTDPIDRAIESHPVLVEYGRYAMQLEPYLHAFGPERILLVPFAGLTTDPQPVFEQIGAFLGAPETFRWVAEEKKANVSRERLRNSPLRDAIVWNPVSTWLRRHLVPRGVRDAIKGLWQMKKRPELAPEVRIRVTETFDADLRILSKWLGLDLTCSNFKEMTLCPEWAVEARP